MYDMTCPVMSDVNTVVFHVVSLMLFKDVSRYEEAYWARGSYIHTSHCRRVTFQSSQKEYYLNEVQL